MHFIQSNNLESDRVSITRKLKYKYMPSLEYEMYDIAKVKFSSSQQEHRCCVLYYSISGHIKMMAGHRIGYLLLDDGREN